MQRLAAASLRGLQRAAGWQSCRSACRSLQGKEICLRVRTAAIVHPSAAQDRLEQAQVDAAWADEPQQLLTVDDFLPSAQTLRDHFTSRFSSPLHTTSDRFVWDYWHVPGQYTLLRTPADQFFPEADYRSLEDAILAFGEQQLGCRGISPVWLSYYIDGCRQELHSDSPHGPWAFVLSLTEWEGRSFSGGETVLFKPHMLDYWTTFDPERGMEMKDMVTLVPPLFNRLTVFDPRYPHGVRRVEGPRDPLKARLVLHGWFTEPVPCFDGPLADEAVAEALQPVLDALYQELGTLPQCMGTLVLRFTVGGENGSVKDLRVLTDTLMPVPPDPEVRQLVHSAIQEHMARLPAFPLSGKGDTVVTLPIIFQ